MLAAQQLARLGDGQLAYRLFQQAEAKDSQAFADVKALHDYARAASIASNGPDAVRLYRLLISRVTLLDDPRERVFAQIEAAAHVLAYVDKGADEALGYLTRARQKPLGLSPWIAVLRVLAMQRSGRGSGAGALASARTLASLGAPPPAQFNAEFPLLPAGLFAALGAAVRERPETAAPVRPVLKGSGKDKSR